MGLGQLRGPSWETGAPLAAPIGSPLSRTAGWRSVMDGPDDCDEKRSRAPPKRSLDGPPSRVRMAGWASPPPPGSIGIIGLGRKSRKIFEFKGLIGKIFRNKDLARSVRFVQDFGSGLTPANRLNLGCQRALEMGLGQLRGPSWLTGTPLATPIRSPLSRMAGWMSVMDGPDVCDEKSRSRTRRLKTTARRGAKSDGSGPLAAGDILGGGVKRANVEIGYALGCWCLLACVGPGETRCATPAQPIRTVPL
jgi:hypothetical protein